MIDGADYQQKYLVSKRMIVSLFRVKQRCLSNTWNMADFVNLVENRKTRAHLRSWKLNL
jgi:hypothetical protein